MAVLSDIAIFRQATLRAQDSRQRTFHHWGEECSPL